MRLDGSMAVLNGNQALFDFPDHRERQIFDTVEKKWIPFTEELLLSIPHTFTYAPRPINNAMQVDYYIRACGLPKHVFIWAVDRIPRNHYGLIRSCGQQFIGRYTFTPQLPSIKEIGRQ